MSIHSNFNKEKLSLYKIYSEELWRTCYENVLIMLATDSAIIKNKECIKLMWQQLMSVSQEIIKVISFYKAYRECYEIFQKKTLCIETPFMKWVNWMRNMLNIITWCEERDYEDIIWEYLLIEARFTKNRDYIITDNDFISCELWMKTWEIQ